MDKIDLILERMDLFETHVKEHLTMCQQLCLTKIENVEIDADKAHERLDDHKKSLTCLFKFKNRQIGVMIGIAIVLSIIGYNIL